MPFGSVPMRIFGSTGSLAVRGTGLPAAVACACVASGMARASATRPESNERIVFCLSWGRSVAREQHSSMSTVHERGQHTLVTRYWRKKLPGAIAVTVSLPRLMGPRRLLHRSIRVPAARSSPKEDGTIRFNCRHDSFHADASPAVDQSLLKQNIRASRRTLAFPEAPTQGNRHALEDPRSRPRLACRCWNHLVQLIS